MFQLRVDPRFRVPGRRLERRFWLDLFDEDNLTKDGRRRLGMAVICWFISLLTAPLGVVLLVRSGVHFLK
jgi:hypothetical protein